MRKAYLIGTAAASLLAAAPTAGLAQSAAATDAVKGDQKTASQLTEVVVTAERRTENLQTVAIAASVLDATALDKKGVVSMADLQNATPGLSITNTGLVANVNIRGIGLDSGSPQVVPGVASYRDGLWQPPVTSTTAFYDIGSVEVLRGPQGTFVGSNSTGGAIFINSRSPDFGGLHGQVEGMVANYGDYGGNGAVNLPVSQDLAARVAFNLERRDSFYKMTGANKDAFRAPGSLDEQDLRFGLLWKPSDALQVLLKSDFSDKATGGYAWKPIATTAYAPFAPSAPFTLNYDQPTKNNEKTIRNSLEIKWQPSPDGITIRSLTGVQYMDIKNVYDNDATASSAPAGPPALGEFQNVIERPLSEEINVLSPTTGAFSWIFGGFYLHDTRKVVLDNTSQAFPAHVLVNLLTTIEDEAAFGQVSYKIVPSLELQVGARFTHDLEQSPSGDGVNIGPGVVFVPAAGSHTDDVATGKVALNWTANDDNFFYAFAAKGFKSGGFDFGFPSPQFQPEVVWDYEVGWKSYFLDRHIRTQLGGFWNTYQNLQVTVINPVSGNSSLSNIGQSTIKGFEAQAEGRFGGFRVDGAASYVDSTLGSISLVNARLLPGGGAVNLGPQCAPGVPAGGCFNYLPTIVSVSGRANPYAPQWTYNIGAEYTFDLAGGASLTPRLNYSYQGSQWTTLIEAPATDLLPAYGLLNATLTYRKADWRVEAFGSNLANKVYVIGQSGNNQFYGAPRQFGLRVSRAF